MASCYRLDGIRFNRKFLGVKQACRKDTEVPHVALDRAWIESQVGRCPDPRQRSDLRRRYGERYQAVFDAEPTPHRQEGRARFAANTELREYIETHFPTLPEGQPLESY